LRGFETGADAEAAFKQASSSIQDSRDGCSTIGDIENAKKKWFSGRLPCDPSAAAGDGEVQDDSNDEDISDSEKMQFDGGLVVDPSGSSSSSKKPKHTNGPPSAKKAAPPGGGQVIMTSGVPPAAPGGTPSVPPVRATAASAIMIKARTSIAVNRQTFSDATLWESKIRRRAIETATKGMSKLASELSAFATEPEAEKLSKEIFVLSDQLEKKFDVMLEAIAAGRHGCHFDRRSGNALQLGALCGH
jgi:hypothetical protein